MAEAEDPDVLSRRRVDDGVPTCRRISAHVEEGLRDSFTWKNVNYRRARDEDEWLYLLDTDISGHARGSDPVRRSAADISHHADRRDRAALLHLDEHRRAVAMAGR